MEILKNVLLWIFAIFGGLTIMSIALLSTLSFFIKRINNRLDKMNRDK